ncbi:acyl CoA:acetate/3-ketoacid CoA transferase [Hominifimenecus sp. rT4P-3]|uniref:acyl CoA:acetate/3-ketoacid CoA transferase n=1 Tax=Hominifimenecus sp. rT4P-3 TaxID=3242979 RepID=UPI003DA4B89E
MVKNTENYRRVPVLSPSAAASLIPSAGTVCFCGAGGGIMEPTTVIEALAKHFDECGEPRNLTIVTTTGLGDRAERGISPLAKEGLCKRAILGHWGQSPRICEMAEKNLIEGYNYPQGVLSQMWRAIAAHQPGIITQTGLGTFLDPRQKGAKLNDVTKEDLVSLMEIDGEEYLFYKAFKPDVCVIRGSTADVEGYISLEDEVTLMDVLPMAQAAHNSGGIVIAQVKRLVKKGSIPPKEVKVPGYLVDYLVVCEDQEPIYGVKDASYIGGHYMADEQSSEPLPLTERKVIARRALMEAKPGDVGNLGVGIADGIGACAAEEGIDQAITLTTEHGVSGGVTVQGHAFGACVNMKSIVDMPAQFDFYDGGGLDICYVSFAEVDEKGNVNVHKFNGKIMGTGGFVNITQNSKKVVFCGTLKSGKLRTKVGDGKIEITQEGKFVKMVRQVEEITFSSADAIRRNQEVLYVTERAVFRLTKDGVMLTEVAPGIDIEKDVLAHMDFKPLLAEKIGIMDERIFTDVSMNLDQDWFH